MGMYDIVHCKQPLPVVWPEVTFQTKSLGCGMDSYWITADGALMLSGRDLGTYRIDDMRIPISGSFEFYDIAPARGQLRLRAVFVSGVCRRIELVDWRPYPHRPDQTPPQLVRPE